MLYRLFALACLAVALVVAPPVRAQLQDRQQDLLTLSEYLGALHHLRGQCERGEARVWREAMKDLVRHEEPSAREARAMTERFNDGYRDARDRFPECTRETAFEGRVTAQEAAYLTGSLRRAIEDPDERY